MRSPENPLVLREYERVDVELTAAAASALQAGSGGALAIEPTVTPGRYQVRAGSLVGNVVAGGLQVAIRPKIPLRNLLYLLGIGHDDIRWWERTFPYERELELLPALLAFFTRSLQRSLAAGLLRTYRWHEERLLTVRGRIDFPAQLSKPGERSTIACTYEEFTADNLLNRYLRVAVRRALLVPDVPPALRRVLLGELVRFDEVEDIALRTDAIDGHVHNRLDEHYRTPLALARLILEGGTLVDRAGATAASAFLIDMNRLFEDFVAERLRRYLEPALGVDREPPEPFDRAGHVRTRPDIVLRDRGGKVVHVADVKYKLSSSGLARNGDYYQLLSYATILRQREGSLIYHDAGEGDPPPRTIEVRNSDVSLTTYRLNLSGQLDAVEEELRRLADAFRSRVADGPPEQARVA
jgi:5-methylcytosine-specific restriction enzyme subunit McrC